MPAKKITPREWLELLVEKAVDLRKAGVYHVELDGCKAALTPHSEPVERQNAFVETGDPLLDPTTFSHTPGARMPRFRRLGDDS